MWTYQFLGQNLAIWPLWRQLKQVGCKERGRYQKSGGLREEYCLGRGTWGHNEADGRRDFWKAFATSTPSLSPTNLRRILWKCGLARRRQHWQRLMLKHLVFSSALSRAKSTKDSSPARALYGSNTGGGGASSCCSDMRATTTELEAEDLLSSSNWFWSSLMVISA